jgi:hypothetical protein
MPLFELTRWTKSDGPLTKSICLGSDGKIISDGSACVMSHGRAERVQVHDVSEFSELISGLNSNQAIALGMLRPGLADHVRVVTKRKLDEFNGTADPGIIARTGSHIVYAPERPAFALLDFDTKGMPPEVKSRLSELGGFWPALLTVLPPLATTAHVIRRSTSAGLFRSDTGDMFRESNGFHVFVAVQDGRDSERFLKTLHARCWLVELGWMMVSASGQLLERSIVDRMVGAPERLVFEGAPVLKPPLAQDQESRRPVAKGGSLLDTVSACPSLTILEKSRLRQLHAREGHRLAPDSARARQAFIAERTAKMVQRTGLNADQAARIVTRQCEGVLRPDVVLPFDDPDLAGRTVAHVLADPAAYEGATLADPNEGTEYGVCKARIMRRSDGTPWIRSFAHGRTVYELRHDHRSIEAALRSVDPDNAIDTFVGLWLAAELGADEEQSLRELVQKIAGVKARPLAARLKAARAEQESIRANADKERLAAERSDARIKLPVPAPDAELLPILRAIDDVLCASPLAEPPMRDLERWPTEVRSREAFRLRGMIINDASENEADDETDKEPIRLPPPKMWLLSPQDRFTMAHLIEEHTEFVQETKYCDRAVALPAKFVEHYIHFNASKLPLVGAVVTNPLVLPHGELLAPDGLDRDRRVVFKIEPMLRNLLPKPAECTPNAVSRAMHFLVDEWLCDVATSFEGKCVLIAAAMTILERTLLPERPVFFVTAGQRGGGKTTVLNMLFIAACGHHPPACAWSADEEERRKAMFSYLREGVAAVVWDNIPRGTAISCPTIEKATTSETYSDRVLKESRTETVPALTINLFTGNNIAPRGDMASRSLQVRLAVDRLDPENRPFKHPDPLEWTKTHRGNIIHALYTIMLGNPRLRSRNATPAETRFKPWWHLIGSAIEYGAALLVEEIEALVVDSPREAPPTRIKFRALLNAFEVDEEQSSALATVLELLRSKWPGGFKASYLVNFVGAADETAINFKACLELASQRPIPIVAAHIINWRLKALIDTPVMAGDAMLVLKYVPERGHGGMFCVRSSADVQPVHPVHPVG